MIKRVNWNTLLIALVGAIATGTFSEMKATHDAVIQINARMSTYDTQLADIRTRLSAVELEILKLKDK